MNYLRSSRSRRSSIELGTESRRLLRDPRTPSCETLTEPTPNTKKDSGNAFQDARRRLQGWRSGVLIAGVMTSIIFVLNLTTAIATLSRSDVQNGTIVALEGSCQVVNHWSLAIHFLINVLSSLLLGASNYTMQVLNAPTRSECDAAHARLDWYDIGVPSLRNLTRVPKSRMLLWAVLLVSSVPVHLLYNSAVFKTTGSNAYTAVLATPEFLDRNESAGFSTDGGWAGSEEDLDLAREVRAGYLDLSTTFEKLTNAECLDTYAVYFVSDYSDLILVASEASSGNSSVWWAKEIITLRLWDTEIPQW